MKIKKFKAENMTAALTMIKAELGPEAVILNTKALKGGILSGKTTIEVTAALDDSLYAKPNSNIKLKSTSQNNTFANTPNFESQEKQQAMENIRSIAASIAPTAVENNTQKKVMTYSPKAIKRSSNNIINSNNNNTATIDEPVEEKRTRFNMNKPTNELNSIYDDMDRMKNTINNMSRVSSTGNKHTKWVTNVISSLRRNEIEEKYITSILDSIYEECGEEGAQNKQTVLDATRKIIENNIRTSKNIHLTEGKTTVVAMIGPTGVGKTTSIAKIAAHFTLKEKKKVALIAADNYRIAAIDQLRTFANIANIPVSVVFNEDEIKSAVEKYQGYDLVLIDTAGRNQKNKDQMEDLSNILDSVKLDEVHLVTSMTTKNSDLRAIVSNYSELGFSHILLTKFDETFTYGSAYNLSKATGKPISFITIGQNVPDDICLASSKELANMILNGKLS